MLKITTEQQILETALAYVHSCKMCFDWQSTENGSECLLIKDMTLYIKYKKTTWKM